MSPTRVVAVGALLLAAVQAGCWETPIQYEKTKQVPSAARGAEVQQLEKALQEAKSAPATPAPGEPAGARAPASEGGAPAPASVGGPASEPGAPASGDVPAPEAPGSAPAPATEAPAGE